MCVRDNGASGADNWAKGLGAPVGLGGAKDGWNVTRLPNNYFLCKPKREFGP